LGLYHAAVQSERLQERSCGNGGSEELPSRDQVRDIRSGAFTLTTAMTSNLIFELSNLISKTFPENPISGNVFCNFTDFFLNHFLVSPIREIFRKSGYDTSRRDTNSGMEIRGQVIALN
jgi:hypothetical protein